MSLQIKSANTCAYDQLSLGEVMLRLDPGEGRIRTAREFKVWEGGGEYNTSRGLRKCFGYKTAVCTAFVDNEIGHLVEDFIMQSGVATDFIKWREDDGIGRTVRNGLNFTERGFGIRGAVGTPSARGSSHAMSTTDTERPITPSADLVALAERDLLRVGAFAAVLLGAWGQTQWSNSTETEVYSVALATIALVTFLVFYWADHLEEGKDWNLLLLVVFLMGLSIGNHLMALLVMPAVVVYVLMTVWDRHRDYVLSLLVGALGLYITVLRGFSVDGILAGESVINPGTLLVGLIVLGLGLWWMARTGALPFFLGAVLLFAAGASVILFLKIRAGLDPAVAHHESSAGT